MAYDDGYYYGQCKIICESETVDDNGRTVAITDGTNTWSAALADKVAEFMVPGRNQYTITLLDGDVNKYTTKVEAGYGECIHVMLADGYEVVVKKQLDELDDRVGSTEGRLNTIDGKLGAYEFGVDGGGRPSYRRGGADSWHPFNNKSVVFTSSPVDMKQYTDFWRNLTDADFVVGLTSVTAGAWGDSGKPNGGGTDVSGAPAKSYNASTGTLTFSGVQLHSSGYGGSYNTNVDLNCNGPAFAVWLGTVAGK